MVLSTDFVTGVLEALYAVQLALRDVWHALGLSGAVADQPAWPFAQRLAAERLLLEPGHARRVVITLACVAVAVVLLLFALVLAGLRRPRQPLHARRRRLWRHGLVAGAAALLVFAPWPNKALLWAPAVPTSLHRAPQAFSTQSIAQGQAVFTQHCAQCHGADARGEGPLASQLAQWPPNLAGGLLWKRLEGELFWRVRHGMRDARSGAQTMPGAPALSDQEIWSALDYLQARASGQMLRDMGAWERPVRLPASRLNCRYGGLRSSDSLRGQRLQLVLPSAGEQALPKEDPRWVTVVLGTPPMGAAHAAPECLAEDRALLPALALLLGVAPQEVPGHRLFVDRDGWLRARSVPGQAAWSEDDLICRSESAPAPPAAVAAAADAPPAQGVDGLLRRMDADRMRLVRAGYPH
ncbi:cytochrome c [Pantoea sp. 18069]|uniref:c-type cytochrome n=1 Tax=Pantoea sp. 18069 TaxID=2681415 RepID=UPI00135A363D|nr:cytochrome c [Pantoea sp. 18069]